MKMKDGRYSITKDYKKAMSWKKITKANNVIERLPKNLRSYNLSPKYVEQEYGEIKSPAKPIELEYDILDKVRNISAFAREIEERRLYLIEQLQIIDLEIVDIQHAAEFYTLSASQGYKLYKLLHNTMVQRRSYKDELKKIDLSLGTSIRKENMENLERSIQGMGMRKYTPRINKALFDV